MQLPRETLRKNVTGYVRNLESVLIRTLADYGIVGKSIPSLTGVWVDEEKVCAIGVRINVKAVTKHGFALNINTNLDYFKGIVPCGIQDKGVTSLAQILGTHVDEAEVLQRVIHYFGTVFGREMFIAPPESLPNL
jgi:lipoate-protein ligase B